MAKKRGGIISPTPSTPRYAVVYPQIFVGLTAQVFISAENAVQCAERNPGSRIFGLNPEYEYQVVRTLNVKE